MVAHQLLLLQVEAAGRVRRQAHSDGEPSEKVCTVVSSESAPLPTSLPLVQVKREWEREKAAVLAATIRQHEREMERLRAEHEADLLRLNERHREVIAQTKRKQWVSST